MKLSGEEMKNFLAAKLKLPQNAITKTAVTRYSIDARRRGGAKISYVYNLSFALADEAAENAFLSKAAHFKNKIFSHLAKTKPTTPSVWEKIGELKNNASHFPINERPIVVGFGPAGMFAALALARAGLQPLVLERGASVEERQKIVEAFWCGGKALDENTNVQFGEGGAGTFSDGKLFTRVDNPLVADVLKTLVEFGAPQDILINAKAHVGTDLLGNVVKNLRESIKKLGGEVRFLAIAEDFIAKDGKIAAVQISGGEIIKTNSVFLAIGHSARDTYQKLYGSGVKIEAKPFAVGVRIEHPQNIIGTAQYGTASTKLPPADYSLTYHDAATGRGVYSFCMCPGGLVVAAASEKERLVTNGMSYHARNSGIANAALLVSVNPTDFKNDVFGGIEFQRRYEAAAYRLGGGNYFAPVQSVGDFLLTAKGEKTCATKDFCLAPTYRPGVKNACLANCLPDFAVKSIADALPVFGKKIAGYDAPDVPMTGVEMRSSSPCRITRDKNSCQSLNIAGLYPIGEGAGYAGGITSAAIDGLSAAMKFLGI